MLLPTGTAVSEAAIDGIGALIRLAVENGDEVTRRLEVAE
jgi:SpoU rRNA methylase family enzyme